MTPNGMQADGFAERRANYERLRRAGVDVIRLDIPWIEVEPVGEPLRDYVGFERLDREVGAIRRAGLGVIGLLAYGHPDYSQLGAAVAALPGAGGGVPPFGVGAAHLYPPDDPADFARYAAAVARHFGREVIAWEVWNEQNEGWRFWLPHEDPAAYADLLCATEEALAAVDPRTPVVYGGTFFPAVPPGLPGMSGPAFVRASYAAEPDLGGCYDVLAYHPYPYPFTAPEVDVPPRGSVLSADGVMRDAQPPADRDKPRWITEIGWPTNDRAYGVGRHKQAQYLVRTLAASFARGVPLVNLYTYGDEPDPSGLNQEAAFGVFDSENRPKPAYVALRIFERILGNARFVRDLRPRLGLASGGEFGPGGSFALRFADRGRRTTILWNAGETTFEGQGPGSEEGGESRRVTVELPLRSSKARLVGLLGRDRRVRAVDGAVRLELGPAPVYVVELKKSG